MQAEAEANDAQAGAGLRYEDADAGTETPTSIKYGDRDDPAQSQMELKPRYSGDRPEPIDGKRKGKPGATEEQGKAVKTLGEGPVAPVEAAENALGAGQGDVDGGYIDPGLKGWLNLLGVSGAFDADGTSLRHDQGSC